MFQVHDNKPICFESDIKGVEVLFYDDLNSIVMLLQVQGYNSEGINF